MRFLLVITLAVLAAACTADAQDDSSFPFFEQEGGRVRDYADLFSFETEANLAAQLDSAQAAYGYQMAIVTVSSLEGYAIEDFSIRYANAWKLGDEGRDDGLLMLVAPNERKVRIEVGSGIEASFTDEYCQQVIDDQLLPAFRAGEFEDGVVTATTVMIERMREYPTIPANDNELNIQPMEDAA